MGVKIMTNKINKKQNKENEINPIFAGVTGAVIGAGIAIAGAIMMKDEKNRDKAKKVLKNIENYAQKETGVVEEKVAKGIKKAKNLADSTEKKLQAKAKEAIKASKK